MASYIEHKQIPDEGLHEPKGIVNAGPNTVYVARGDGSGKGDWKPAEIPNNAPNGHVLTSNNGLHVWAPAGVGAQMARIRMHVEGSGSMPTITSVEENTILGSSGTPVTFSMKREKRSPSDVDTNILALEGGETFSQYQVVMAPAPEYYTGVNSFLSDIRNYNGDHGIGPVNPGTSGFLEEERATYWEYTGYHILYFHLQGKPTGSFRYIDFIVAVYRTV